MQNKLSLAKIIFLW